MEVDHVISLEEGGRKDGLSLETNFDAHAFMLMAMSYVLALLCKTV
jgi:hypothetical protein